MSLDDRVARAAERGDTLTLLNLINETRTFGTDAGVRAELQLALLWAALGEQEETIAELCRQGADLNAPEPHRGHLAIVAAAHHGNIASVKMLLRMGADPTLRDSTGRNAIEEARRRRNIELVRVLEAADF